MRKTSKTAEEALNRIAELTALLAKEYRLAAELTTKRKAKPESYTVEQTAQRIQLANVVTIYKLLAPVVKGGYPSGGKHPKPYNAFLKDNLSRVKVYLDKNEAASSCCVIAPYQITHGMLTPVEIVPEGRTLVTSLRMKATFEITPETTLGDVAYELIARNRGLIKDGDKLTIVKLTQEFYDDSLQPVAQVNTYSVLMDTRSEIPFRTMVPESVFRPIYGRVVCYDAKQDLGPGGVAYVLHREQNNKIRASSQSVVLTPDNDTYARYASEERKQQAAKTYMKSTETCFLEPKESEEAPENRE